MAKKKAAPKKESMKMEKGEKKGKKCPTCGKC